MEASDNNIVGGGDEKYCSFPPLIVKQRSLYGVIHVCKMFLHWSHLHCLWLRHLVLLQDLLYISFPQSSALLKIWTENAIMTFRLWDFSANCFEEHKVEESWQNSTQHTLKKRKTRERKEKRKTRERKGKKRISL